MMNVVNDVSGNCTVVFNGSVITGMAAVSASGSGYVLGGLGGGANSWNGYVAEVIVYNKALNPIQRTRVEGYLAWKWGLVERLSAQHFYKARGPSPLRPFNWTPTFTRGCRLWLDAADSSAVTLLDPSGSMVSVWKDKSGSHNDAIAPISTTGALQVLFKASDYSGTGDWLDQSGYERNATLENGTATKNLAGNGIVLDGSSNWTFPNVAVGNVWTAGVWFKRTGAQVGENGGNSAGILTQIGGGSVADLNLLIGDIIFRIKGCLIPC
jgi:hypothetical protein